MLSAASTLSSTMRTRCPRSRRSGSAASAVCSYRVSSPDEQRQRDHELAALPQSLAERLDGAAVELHQLPDERQANAQARASFERRGRPLREEVEDPAEHLGGDAHAVVADRHDRAAITFLGRHGDSSALRRVLRRVVQEIGEDLAQAHRIPVNGDWRVEGMNRQTVPGCVDERPADVDRVSNDPDQIGMLAMERDLSAGDPRDLQQVVDEPDHVIDLALHHLAHARRDRIGRFRQPEHLDRVGDGRERVPQLVRQHREELVFPAVRLVQRRGYLVAMPQVRANLVLTLARAEPRSGSR